MNRRAFLKALSALVVVAAIPSISYLSSQGGIVIVNHELIDTQDSFGRIFRVVAHPIGKPNKLAYCAVQVNPSDSIEELVPQMELQLKRHFGIT